MTESLPRRLSVEAPRTIVYQNADFVSAMLQEIYQAGLLQPSESDAAGKNSTSENRQKKAAAGANVEGTAPLLAKAAGKLDGEWVRQQTEADERSSAQRQKFVYSQAHYLDAVRRGLAERGHFPPMRSPRQLETSWNLRPSRCARTRSTPCWTSQLLRWLGK